MPSFWNGVTIGDLKPLANSRKILSFGRKHFVLESGLQKEKYFFHLWCSDLCIMYA